MPSVYVIQIDSMCYDVRRDVARDYDRPEKPEVWKTKKGAIDSAKKDAQQICDEYNQDYIAEMKAENEEVNPEMLAKYEIVEEDGQTIIFLEENTRWTINKVPLQG